MRLHKEPEDHSDDSPGRCGCKKVVFRQARLDQDMAGSMVPGHRIGLGVSLEVLPVEGVELNHRAKVCWDSI
jgi:hypothetical protein